MPNCGLEEHAGAGTEHNECGKTKRDGQRCPRLGRQGPGTGYLRGVGTAKKVRSAETEGGPLVRRSRRGGHG